MFFMLKKKIYPAYDLKHNSNQEKQVVFFHNFKQRMMPLSCSQKTTGIIKGTHSEKTAPNKNPALRKSTNMGVWAVGTLNQ